VTSVLRFGATGCVPDGAWMTIGDQVDDEADRHVATVLAEAVPGVFRVHAAAVHPEDGW